MTTTAPPLNMAPAATRSAVPDELRPLAKAANARGVSGHLKKYAFETYGSDNLGVYVADYEGHTYEQKVENLKRWLVLVEDGTFDSEVEKGSLENGGEPKKAAEKKEPAVEAEPKAAEPVETEPVEKAAVKENKEPVVDVAAALSALQKAIEAQRPAESPAPHEATIDPAKLEALVKQSADTIVESKTADTLEEFKTIATDQLNASIDRIAKAHQRKSVIESKGEPLVTIEGASHYKLPLLVLAAKARVPIYLHGPAGSGKTSAAQQIADTLELPCHIVSVGKATTKTDILGYISPHSDKLIETPFYKAYVNGGVLLVDEFDSGSPASMIYLNAMMANKRAAFADGEHDRHPDFIAIAGGNTIGQGGSSDYNGRSKLDAATLDRFAFIEWDADDAFEREICGVPADESTRKKLVLDCGGTSSPEEWVDWVQRFRSGLADSGVRHVTSMRASISGLQLLNQGIGVTHVRTMLAFKGMERATVEKVLNAMPKP